jgi:NitT/TauT family transport system permease protein
MARVYGFGKTKTLLHVFIPSIKGTFLAALSASIGLCWKAMIAAEVLGTPKEAVGTMLYNAKIYLNTDELFAWTAIIIIISRLMEICFAKTLIRKRKAEGHRLTY